MATYAGFFGPQALVWTTSGTPVRDTPITVLDADTLIPTTLYATEQKLATVSNPVKTDSRGNLSFYAVPGEYLLFWPGAIGYTFVTVNVHPDDPAGGGGGVTDHGALTGLSDNDHPQYSLTSHTHTASQVTDFNTAVDSRIANVVGSAPAALDTLGELSDALGDDANFAATVTTLLAAKAPLNSPTFTGTVSGVTKAMVGLGNADNTSDANKPISTATQAALDAKASASHGHTLETLHGAFGHAAMSVPPNTTVNTASPAQNAIVITLMAARPGQSISALRAASQSAATYSATGQPAQCRIYDFDGVLLATSPDDATLWLAAGWRTCTFASAFTVPSNGLIYFGLSFGGFTGAGFAKADGLSLALIPGLTGGKRFSIFDSGAPLPASFNPATFGSSTSWVPMAGLVAA